MNKQNLFLIVLAVMLTFCFCGIASAEFDGTVNHTESELYTADEINAAVPVIMAEFSNWDGCEMHSMTYAGDARSMDELEASNSLDRGVFDESLVIISAFRSPKKAYAAWEEDQEYVWTWSLGRADKGEWQLVNWGWAEPFVKSGKYTVDEMAAAQDAIYAEMDRMEGTRMHFISYQGDEFSMSQLDYVNSLDRGTFDEAAVFEVWFQSPAEAYGAWEPDMVYVWSFYLARADKGDWTVVTFGY